MPFSFEQTVVVLEYVLVLAGLGCLVWLFFSAAGRAVRARPPALPAWNVTTSDFLFMVWLVVTLGFLGQVLLRVAAGPTLRRQPEGETLELIAFGSMFQAGAMLAWAVSCAYFRRYRSSADLAGMSWPRVNWVQAGRAAAFTLVVAMPLLYAASGIWEPLIRVMGLPTEHQELVDRFAQTKSPLLLALMITLALVIAPIAEELVFRAGLFRFLRTRTPRWVALTASSGLFALPHANWAGFVPLFLLGLIFNVAYERTGRIAVPMLAHALFNLNTLLLVLSGVGR